MEIFISVDSSGLSRRDFDREVMFRYIVSQAHDTGYPIDPEEAVQAVMEANLLDPNESESAYSYWFLEQIGVDRPGTYLGLN
jgi:hypothetical protein